MLLFCYLRRLFILLLFSCAAGSGVYGQHHHSHHEKHAAKPDTLAIAPAAPVPHVLVAKPAELIDQDSADDRPCFTLDGRTMYFGSRRESKDAWRVPDQNPQWKWDSDLWSRFLTDSGWSSPVNLGPRINNSYGQLNPTVSPRGDELYFVSSGPVLWKAHLVNGTFQPPVPVGGMLNRIYNNRTSVQGHVRDSILRIVEQEMIPDSDLRLRAPDAWELHVREHLVQHYKTQMAVDFVSTVRCETSITPDGKYGIISENFGKKGSYGLGGEGGEDIWLVTIDANGDWDTILVFNGNINSEYDETYPFIAADGVTLYFTSNRPCPTCAPGTSGRQDLYRTQYDGTHWSAIQFRGG